MVENKKDIEQLKKAMKKCLCPLEKPLDAAQARLVVIKTYDVKDGHRIWKIAQKYPLTMCRFTMWKFCILLHKILYEGHPQVLRDSLLYREQLQGYGNYWRLQSTDQMAPCIARYCKVLLRKLSFHQTYTHFKGNFRLEYEPNVDVNSSFQLCLDMCDYLEDLLQLQHLIFTNIKQDGISTQSKKGLCRLTALATIIDDCNLLYQHSVDALIQLHSQLPPDDISGLSERFTNVIHVELRRFFEKARDHHSSLNYVEIPELPLTVPLPNNDQPTLASCKNPFPKVPAYRHSRPTTSSYYNSYSGLPVDRHSQATSSSSNLYSGAFDNRHSYEPSAPIMWELDD